MDYLLESNSNNKSCWFLGSTIYLKNIKYCSVARRTQIINLSCFFFLFLKKMHSSSSSAFLNNPTLTTSSCAGASEKKFGVRTQMTCGRLSVLLNMPLVLEEQTSFPRQSMLVDYRGHWLVWPQFCLVGAILIIAVFNISLCQVKPMKFLWTGCSTSLLPSMVVTDCIQLLDKWIFYFNWF